MRNPQPKKTEIFDPHATDFATVNGDARRTASVSASTTTRLDGTFGRYEIQRILGEGAMGAVYLARDTQLNREVALKTPKFDATAEPRSVERFYREARSAATLRHPSICPVHDVGEIDGCHYITMAYIDGHPLSKYVSLHKPQPERKVAGIIRKVALALEHAHGHNVIHRDLKPANIMVDGRGEPIVMDFGLARQLDAEEDGRLTCDGTLLGTPAYMSPEQIEGKGAECGIRSDVYSLGVIMFELLTGRLPYQETGAVISMIKEIMLSEPADIAEVRPEVAPELVAICQKSIAKKVADRYASMAEFAADLTDFLKAKFSSETIANDTIVNEGVAALLDEIHKETDEAETVDVPPPTGDAESARTTEQPATLPKTPAERSNPKEVSGKRTSTVVASAFGVVALVVVLISWIVFGREDAQPDLNGAPGANQSSHRPSRDKFTHRFFDEHDTDGDQRLSLDELRSAPPHVFRADTDRDDWITLREYQVFQRNWNSGLDDNPPPSPPREEQQPEVRPRDNVRRPPIQLIDELMRARIGGDEKVRRNELPEGARRVFDEIDSDNNGVVTPREIHRFRPLNKRLGRPPS